MGDMIVDWRQDTWELGEPAMARGIAARGAMLRQATGKMPMLPGDTGRMPVLPGGRDVRPTRSADAVGSQRVTAGGPGRRGYPTSGGFLQAAGGIGGLLAVYDADASDGYVYFHDANGNVGQLVAWENGYGNASGDDWHADRLVAGYEVSPIHHRVQTGATGETGATGIEVLVANRCQRCRSTMKTGAARLGRPGYTPGARRTAKPGPHAPWIKTLRQEGISRETLWLS